MVLRQRRYSKEEFARRGQELYETGIRQQVESSTLENSHRTSCRLSLSLANCPLQVRRIDSHAKQ